MSKDAMTIEDFAKRHCLDPYPENVFPLLSEADIAEIHERLGDYVDRWSAHIRRSGYEACLQAIRDAVVASDKEREEAMATCLKSNLEIKADARKAAFRDCLEVVSHYAKTWENDGDIHDGVRFLQASDIDELREANR